MTKIEVGRRATAALGVALALSLTSATTANADLYVDGAQETDGLVDTQYKAGIPNEGCRTTGAYVSLYSVVGTRLWTFRVSKYWCWNRKKKDVDVVKDSITSTVAVGQAAAIAGWDYKGLDAKTDYFYSWKSGEPKSGHWTHRTGVFKYCPPRVACANTRRPALNLRVHSDGTASMSRDVG